MPRNGSVIKPNKGVERGNDSEPPVRQRRRLGLEELDAANARQGIVRTFERALRSIRGY